MSEDVKWPRFQKVCYENMQLREGCEPQLTWKFNDGRGSKEWITLQDEGSYARMMKAGAERIRARARKETNIKEPNLGFGWRIDIFPVTEVKRVTEVEGGEAIVILPEEEEKGKKRKKASRKVLAKRKRSGRKKAWPSNPSILILP